MVPTTSSGKSTKPAQPVKDLSGINSEFDKVDKKSADRSAAIR